MQRNTRFAYAAVTGKQRRIATWQPVGDDELRRFRVALRQRLQIEWRRPCSGLILLTRGHGSVAKRFRGVEPVQAARDLGSLAAVRLAAIRVASHSFISDSIQPTQRGPS